MKGRSHFSSIYNRAAVPPGVKISQASQGRRAWDLSRWSPQSTEIRKGEKLAFALSFWDEEIPALQTSPEHTERVWPGWDRKQRSSDGCSQPRALSVVPPTCRRGVQRFKCISTHLHAIFKVRTVAVPLQTDVQPSCFPPSLNTACWLTAPLGAGTACQERLYSAPGAWIRQEHPVPSSSLLTHFEQWVTYREEIKKVKMPQIKTENKPMSSYRWFHMSFRFGTGLRVWQGRAQQGKQSRILAAQGPLVYLDKGTEKSCSPSPQEEAGLHASRGRHRQETPRLLNTSSPVSNSPPIHCLSEQRPWIPLNERWSFSEYRNSEKQNFTLTFKC